MPPSAAGPAVRARGLTRRYGERLALDEVDLDVAAGELRGLLGPNGAGKTTLLRTLLRLVSPDTGHIELLGRRLAPGIGLPLEGVAGFVEEPAFWPYLSGRSNLEVLVELDDGDPARIDRVLEEVGLADRASDRVGGWSTGMRQRLGIAAALLRRPRVLLLDEPTSGLDPAGIRAVGALLRGLAADGVAILVSSHAIGELEATCGSYTLLRAGRVVWDGTTAELEAQAPGAVHLLATSDDARALAIARQRRDVDVSPAATGLEVAAAGAGLDDYVRSLVLDGLAVRRLELLAGPLERMFFARCGEAAA